MKDQRGSTLIEVTLAALIVTTISGMAVVSALTVVTRARLSNSTAALADNLSVSREQAMARYQRWMLTFPAPASSAETVGSYQLTSCELSLRACDPSNPADWDSGPNSMITAEPGIGFQVLQPTSSPPQPVRIVFDRTLRNMSPVDVDLKICVTARTAAGNVTCRSGGAASTFRIRKVSGIMQPLR